MSRRLEQIKRETTFIYSVDSESIESADVRVENYEWLIEQAEQTEAFKQLHKKYLDRYVDVVGERNNLLDENKRLREALEFYAKFTNYEQPFIDHYRGPVLGDSIVQEDLGTIAKEALEDTP